MSRCFPFPPPGYEKKPRPEVGDLLKEEKLREKKHKKEKKEKKDKERSDGKHREKKDKKDKHRDKKDKKDKENKDKDKDKDNERSSISEEARVAVLPGASSGPKIPRGDDHVKNESSINSYEPKFVKTSLPAVETQESKFVQELARRIRDEPKAAGSMYIKGNLAEDKEKNKEKRVYCNNAGGIDANAIHPSFPEVAKSKYLGMPRPLEESVGNSRDEKEESKKKDKKEKDKRSRGKEKDREKEKKKEEKVKNKSVDRKSKQDSSSREINKNDFIGVNNTTNVQVPLVPKDNIAGTITDGNLRKRKDIGTNGFLHNHEVRTPKLLRPTSPPWSIQNGTRFETHQKADMLPSSIQGVVANAQALKKEHSLNGTTKLSNTHGVSNDNPVEITKEHGVNGTVKTQSLVISKPKASSSTSPSADQIAEAAKRLPHPDTKYLNRILSVPKMDEWTGFDDQEWLFGSKHSLVKKPDSCLDEVKDYRVWSEALQIDSADVFALPYVIPY